MFFFVRVPFRWNLSKSTFALSCCCLYRPHIKTYVKILEIDYRELMIFKSGDTFMVIFVDASMNGGVCQVDINLKC